MNDTQSIRMSTLTVSTSSMSNATNITCEAIIYDPLTSDESGPALLLVQGMIVFQPCN